MPQVRKLLLPGVIAVAGLLAACGGGDDDPAVGEDANTGSTTATTTPGGGDGSSTTVTIAPGGSPDPNAATTLPQLPTEDTTPIDPATVETLPPANDPPADPGFPPAAPGQYTYNTTGMTAGRPVNSQTITTVTALGPSDIRYASADQILDLQYRPDGIYLRQLVAKFADQSLTFQSPDGVLFIPNPQDAGQSWNWQLTDSTGGLTAVWQGTTLPGETIPTGAGDIGTTVVQGNIAISGRYDVPVLGPTDVAGNVALKLWIDPTQRLPIQLHQVTTISKPALAAGLGADTTSTYAGFTPA